VTAFPTSTSYAALLVRTPPKIIRTEEENEHYIRALEELERRSESLSKEEREFADLLTLLVENFEDTHYKLRPSTPLQVLAELMESNGLKQKDLIDVFGTESVVSEVINGKRELNKDHIKKLSARFNVSPEIFF
jgi:HTH-type transcriptional regulator / antitoxin HigA